MLTLSLGRAADFPPGVRRDLDKDVPLRKAIREYNTKCPDKNPLTEAEVIAAVRDLRAHHPKVTEAIFQLYQRVANEKILPRGMYFSRITGYVSADYKYEVDWKDLTADPLATQTQLGFNYRIRARYLSSRPLTAKEKEDLQNLKPLQPGTTSQ
jgi:hypothetical protein